MTAWTGPLTEQEWRALVDAGTVRVTRSCQGCDTVTGSVQRVVDGQALIAWDDGQRGYTDLINLRIV